MADLKISALTAATTPLAGTEVLPIVQGGVTTKVAVSDLTAGRAVTATSVNKVVITAPTTASTLTIADGKTLAVNDNATLGTGGLTLGNSGGFTAAASKVLTANNSLTLAGTDATTHTFPTTSATIARTDAAQTFTGVQIFGTGLQADNTVTVNSLGINSFASAVVSVSVPTVTPTTLVNASSYCQFNGVTMFVGGDEGNINFCAYVGSNGGGAYTLNAIISKNCTLAMSGTNLQLTHTLGSTSTVKIAAYSYAGR